LYLIATSPAAPHLLTTCQHKNLSLKDRTCTLINQVD